MLIVYGIMAVAAFGAIAIAWSGFKDSIGKPYAEAQRKADQVVVNQAEAAKAAAITDRDTARANTASCEANLKTQASAKADYEKQAKRNLQEARDAKAQAQREATAAAPKIAELQARAVAQPKLEACEVELSKARATMREALERRRGITPVAK